MGNEFNKAYEDLIDALDNYVTHVERAHNMTFRDAVIIARGVTGEILDDLEERELADFGSTHINV